MRLGFRVRSLCLSVLCCSGRLVCLCAYSFMLLTICCTSCQVRALSMFFGLGVMHSVVIAVNFFVTSELC